MIITTKGLEKRAIKMYFSPALGRDIEDYDRYEEDEAGISIRGEIKF
jgi:hypothetical protein